ncbi:MAG: PIN domain-containing protein [Planctomycetota bacterium]
MKVVFADSVYWIAIVRPNDQWAEPSKRAKESLGQAILVTSDEVLTEFLAALSRGGPTLRKKAVEMVRAIMSNPNVQVVPQTREGFLAGIDRYEQREDKEYSLTDCVSMNTMESRGLEEVLSNDHHFEQEGFAALIKHER